MSRKVIEDSIRKVVITTSDHCISKQKKGPLVRPILLGKCHASTIPNAIRVVVKKMFYDDFLHMYFPKFHPCYAYDPDKLCKPGDITLIEVLEKQMTRDITHKILKVVYPMGDVIDPVTGKPCVQGEYRDDMDRKDKLWGQNENAFDYNKAPPRGWQEGRKDWTHKPGYKRWHEFTDRDQHESSLY